MQFRLKTCIYSMYRLIKVVPCWMALLTWKSQALGREWTPVGQNQKHKILLTSWSKEGKEESFPEHLKMSRFLALSQVKTFKLLTMERLALVLDVKVSPLAQSIPNRAQISPA